MCVRGPEDNFICPLQECCPYPLRLSLPGLKLAKYASLVGQGAPGTLLSLPLKGWNYSYVLPYLALSMWGLKRKLGSLC